MNNLPSTSGVYAILFTQFISKGACYVGSAINMHNRINGHLSKLRNKNSNCKKLQRAFNKYGEGNFRCVTLEECDIAMLAKRELHYINTLDAVNKGYNIALDTTMPMLGRKHSIETRLLMSKKSRRHKSNLGKTFSESHKEKIRSGLIGKNKGRKMSIEFCEANRLRNLGDNNPFKGCIHTDETKAAISAANIGRNVGAKSAKARRVGVYKHDVLLDVFDTVNLLAASTYGISRTHIYRCLTGVKVVVKGYTVKYL